jgi:hypothetical protein
MGKIGAPLTLVRARARRHPGRWLLTAVGIGIAVAFAGAVVAEATIAADRSAREVLAGLAPLDRIVRVTWQGVVTPTVEREADGLLHRLDLSRPTEVVLMNPVRLGGIVVRPAAITPLAGSVVAGGPDSTGRCLASDCPMLFAGGGALHQALLTALGVRVPILGSTTLRSAAPLGFIPGPAVDQQEPLVISGDAPGLESLPALSSVYRTHSWLAPLPTRHLHSWQLAATEARLLQAQASLLTTAGQFDLSAPFAGLDAARAQADAAPRRLLLAGGGALAALVLFVVLAAGGLRQDVGRERERLRTAGARTSQVTAFVLAEAGLLCGVAALIGAVISIACAVVLAHAAGVPAGGVLAHSLLTPAAIAALLGGWMLATAFVATSLLARGGRLADIAAVASIAALALALSLSRDATGNDPLPVLLAPLCCFAAGVLAYRGAAVLLKAGARASARGPVLGRLALVSLARSPAAPSLAIAFIAVSTGLGGFALAYRATLLRGTADQAADRVPLDAILAPGPDFTTPLELAPVARWRALAGGPVFGVRRTDATFESGGATTTVPALGVPAAALDRLHGWRTGDASAPIATFARRLVPPGPARTPGPALPPTARFLSLVAGAGGGGVMLTADLRSPAGEVDRVLLGEAAGLPRTLRARIPPGAWELEALTLQQPAGLEATNGHQNGENPAAATQQTIALTISAVRALNAVHSPVSRIELRGWHAIGAAGGARTRAGATTVRFSTTGATGLVRPAQPSDVRSVPVLVDAATAAAAGRGGRLALTVDGEAVAARVVGVLRRFPTVPAGTSGFVVADEQTLAGALEARAPGQGRPDELWLSTDDLSALRSALRSPRLSSLSLTVRSELERQLRAAPIARGVLGTLEAATVLTAVLAIVGLLASLLGAVRDARVERDLIAQGFGPRGLRRELQLRLLLASAIGVAVGLGVAALLTRLAVLSVRAAATLGAPQPPLVTVVPWAALAAWGIVALFALAGAGWLGARLVVARRAVA